MHYKLLLITCLSSALLSGMEDPQGGVKGSTGQDKTTKFSELMNIMPPNRITMEEYAEIPGDSWLHNEREMQEFEQRLISHPLYEEICKKPLAHAELVDTMLSEAKLRICSHAGSACLTIIQPCTPAVLSLFFALKSYNDVQAGQNCCTNCGMSCFLAVATCGRCSKNAKTMRGITKTTQKTFKAYELFQQLQQLTELEEKKNK